MRTRIAEKMDDVESSLDVEYTLDITHTSVVKDTPSWNTILVLNLIQLPTPIQLVAEDHSSTRQARCGGSWPE